MITVLDSSALIALIYNEQGCDDVASAIESGAALAAINLTEISIVLQRKGWRSVDVHSFSEELDVFVVPATREIAMRAASFESEARRLKLSLGDRQCIATAAELGGTALTTDQAWTELDSSLTGAEIHCIR